MSDAVTPEKESIYLVYLGVRMGRSDKLIELWMEVTQEELDEGTLPPDVQPKGTASEKVRVYGGGKELKWMRGSPGVVHKIDQEKGTTQVYCASAKYAGLWPNELHRFGWQAESRTAQTLHDLRRREAKEGAASDMKALAPLRKQYHRLISRKHQAALLAHVIAYITAGDVPDHTAGESED